MTDIQWIQAQVAHTAVRTERRYHGYVEAGDIQQSLWEWIQGHPQKVDRWREDNDQDDFAKILGKVLDDEARMFARREKAIALGYSTEDEFFYAKEPIVDLLPTVLGPREEWATPPTDHGTGGRSTKSLNEGNNWLATLADISSAFSQLSPADRNLLGRIHLKGDSLRDIAREERISVRGIQQREDRAVRRLWNRLGGPKWLEPAERHTHNPRRKAISNAQARAIQAAQYDE